MENLKLQLYLLLLQSADTGDSFHKFMKISPYHFIYIFLNYITAHRWCETSVKSLGNSYYRNNIVWERVQWTNTWPVRFQNPTWLLYSAPQCYALQLQEMQLLNITNCPFKVYSGVCFALTICLFYRRWHRRRTWRSESQPWKSATWLHNVKQPPSMIWTTSWRTSWPPRTHSTDRLNPPDYHIAIIIVGYE